MKGINNGHRNSNWKGGRTITNRGYAKVMVKDHPRADRDGYVLEHIFVMEEKLQRYLTDGEVVHHVNGNKLDNSLDNLQLFENHSEHLKTHSHKLGKEVTCDNCGKTFYKKRSQLSKFNFCSQACVRPHLWNARWGEKGGGAL